MDENIRKNVLQEAKLIDIVRNVVIGPMKLELCDFQSLHKRIFFFLVNICKGKFEKENYTVLGGHVDKN